MTIKERELVSTMLNEYSDRLGNESCNEWEFPKSWTKEERIQFVREYHDWNGDPEEFSKKDLYLPDFGVARFLAFKVSQICL